MSTTPIGTSPGATAADLVQEIKIDLANGISAGAPLARSHKAAGTDTSNHIDNLGAAGHPALNADPSPTMVDAASSLLSEVATSDLTKLTRILDPAPDPISSKVLNALLQSAVYEVKNGNGERAVGYLADYATRDPRRAERLPLEPELEPVRDKIDSMVNRMATVAKMSAEDGLSRAEQSASEQAGKISNWDTHADVLVKIAHRLFEAGGYANYSRSAEIARVVSNAAVHARPTDQAIAAASAANNGSAILANQSAGQMVAGVNMQYFVSVDQSANPALAGKPNASIRRVKGAESEGDLHQNLKALKEVSSSAVKQLWLRAPLLVLLLSWFTAGALGGVAFAIGSHIWPDGLFVEVGNVGFMLWGLGFLAIVGFGFYARIRRLPRR